MKSRIYTLMLLQFAISCTRTGSEEHHSPHIGASCEVIDGDTINRTDDNGLKQGHWLYYKRYNMAIIEEGDYVNNQKEGTWKYYDSTGKVARLVKFKNDMAR